MESQRYVVTDVVYDTDFPLALLDCTPANYLVSGNPVYSIPPADLQKAGLSNLIYIIEGDPIAIKPEKLPYALLECMTILRNELRAAKLRITALESKTSAF